MSISIVVRPDATMEEINLPADERANLAAKYRLIGCDLATVVSLTDGVDMWLDEEGAINGGPLNALATSLAWRLRPSTQNQRFYGTALFCSVDPVTGESVDLDDTQAYMVMLTLDGILGDLTLIESPGPV